MGSITDKAADVYRDFEVAGVPASGPNDPDKSDIRSLFSLIDLAIAAAQAGIPIISNTTGDNPAGPFYATEANRGKLVYVNNNNGSASDPANGVYEYVGGSARIAQGFYQGLATAVQPILDAATAAKTATTVLRQFGYVAPWAAPYMEGGTLRVPRFFQVVDGSSIERSPADGAFWYELPLAVDYNLGNDIVYYDAATNTIKNAPVFAKPADLGSDAKPVIGQFSAGAFHSTSAGATLAANEFDGGITGVAEEMGPQTFMFRPSDATLSGELAAQRIYYTWSAAAGQQIAVGGQFKRKDQAFAFARVFVQSLDGGALIPPNFETYDADHVRDPATGLVGRGTALLEKKFSNTLASYILVANKAIPQGSIGFRAVLSQPSGRQLSLSGLQFCASNDPAAIIPQFDVNAVEMDRVGRMLMPKEIAFFDYQPFDLYPTQMIDTRPIGALLDVYGDGGVNPARIGSGRESVSVDPASIADGSTVLVSRPFDGRLSRLRQAIPVTARKIAQNGLAGKNIGMLFLGDSKTDDWRTAKVIEQIMEANGATVTLTGTLNGYDDATGARFHEGRSGTRLADVVGKRIDNMVPTTPSAYIAAPVFPDRYRLNPFLFAGSGAGSYDGKIFDYGQYLSAYASLLAPHQIVVIDYGTNDKGDFTNQADLVAFVDQAYTTMITSIRAAGKKVIVAPGGNGWEPAANEIQRVGGYAVFRGILRAVNRINDPANVRIAGAWAQMSATAFGSMTAQAVDQDTGVATGFPTDPTHWNGSVRQQYAACVTAHAAHMSR